MAGRFFGVVHGAYQGALAILCTIVLLVDYTCFASARADGRDPVFGISLAERSGTNWQIVHGLGSGGEELLDQWETS